MANNTERYLQNNSEPLTPARNLRKKAAVLVGSALLLAGCGGGEGASHAKDTETPAPTVATSLETPGKATASSSPTAEKTTPRATPTSAGAFATKRVCDGIYVADQGMRVILRPVVNEQNQPLDIADQSAGGVDFMPEPLKANSVEWYQLNGERFPNGKQVHCQDQQLFINGVKQPNGHTTWQMSSVNHQLNGPTQMPWNPDVVRNSFAGVHLDEGAMTPAGLGTIVPGYEF